MLPFLISIAKTHYISKMGNSENRHGNEYMISNVIWFFKEKFHLTSKLMVTFCSLIARMTWSDTVQVIPLTEFYEQKIATLMFELFEFSSCTKQDNMSCFLPYILYILVWTLEECCLLLIFWEREIYISHEWSKTKYMEGKC